MLFINAGIGGFAPLRGITEEAWDQVHAVNCKGCVFALQQALPLIGRGGSVVVTGSIGAHGALEGNGTYAAAKAGLRSVSQTLAREFGPRGIHVAYAVIDGGIASSARFTTASMRTGPSCASASRMPSSTSPGCSRRMP